MLYFCNVKTIILWSNDRVEADFMKGAGFVKYGFKYTSFTVTYKASNMSMPVSLFINFHNLRCNVIHNCHNYTISVFVKVKTFKLCIPKP